MAEGPADSPWYGGCGQSWAAGLEGKHVKYPQFSVLGQGLAGWQFRACQSLEEGALMWGQGTALSWLHHVMHPSHRQYCTDLLPGAGG